MSYACRGWMALSYSLACNIKIQETLICISLVMLQNFNQPRLALQATQYVIPVPWPAPNAALPITR